MRSFLRLGISSLLIACSFVLLAQACSDDKGYDPPRPGDTTSSGSAAGGGGSGPVWDNLCECIADMSVDENCKSCINNSLSPDHACNDLWQQCTVTPTCHMQDYTCLTSCQYSVQCINQCVIPFDLNAERELLADMFTCACNVCRDVCLYSEALKCDGTDGQMGGGGTGGIGGTGGTAGTGGTGGMAGGGGN